MIHMQQMTKENVVSNSYETICTLSSKAMTLW